MHMGRTWQSALRSRVGPYVKQGILLVQSAGKPVKRVKNCLQWVAKIPRIRRLRARRVMHPWLTNWATMANWATTANWAVTA